MKNERARSEGFLPSRSFKVAMTRGIAALPGVSLLSLRKLMRVYVCAA